MAGRPRKDTIEIHTLIINLAQAGMNNTQIAGITGVDRATIQRYLSQTDLGEAVKTVRETMAGLDAEKKASLNKAALQAARRLLRKRKAIETTERTDKTGAIIYTETRTKEIEPNAGIVQFVLKNTDPQNWSENQTANNTDAENEDTELRIVIDNDNQNQ